MIDKSTATVVAVLVIAGVAYLSFVNWKAAVIVLLFFIWAQLANNKGQQS